MSGWIRSTLTVLLVLAASLIAAAAPAEAPLAICQTGKGGVELVELLPETTLVAVEIRDLARRWPDIRAIPAIARLQDHLLAGSGLGPDDLPRLAGEHAVLALVAAGDGRTVMPLAVLCPPRMDEAETTLRAVAPAALGGAALTTRRGRGALWIGPSEESARLEEIAAGEGTSPRRSLMTEEVSRRLPAGGLVRGWLDPVALQTLLDRRVEGIEPLWIDVFRAFASAELDAARFMGFRRDVSSDGVVTDAVIGFDPAVLPVEVARALGSSPDSVPVLPSPLPPDVLLAVSFRTEAEASLAWLRHVAERDPRGPLRNVDFWIGELHERYDRDLEKDLVEALGERGWLFLLEGDTNETMHALLIVEARDATRLEGTLLKLRSWLVEQACGRSLGWFSPRVHDDSVSQTAVHGLTFRTPFAELPGPMFLVTDGHILFGTGTDALRSGLELLRSKSSWVGGAGTPHESIRVQGSTLSRCAKAMVERHAPALAGALADLESVAIDVWHEEDAVRIRGRVRFD